MSARAISILLLALACASCSDGPDGDGDSGGGDPDAGGEVDAQIPTEDTGTGIDAPGTDAGPDFRDEFFAALDGTVWSATQTRNETGGDITRAYELHFQGGGEPMFGEIRNPYGPARLRILRFMRIARDGCESASRCVVDTTVSIPDASWETPDALRGRMESYTIEIIGGAGGRALSITDEDAREEIFDEGAWPRPTSGLTAEIRVFEGGDGNPISEAFCTVDTGSFSNPIDQPTMWEFARGDSSEPTLGYELAAGVQLGEWNDVANRFGVRDVDGFQIDDLGGSLRTDQFYFTVRYRGFVAHPGGRFQMREEDDAVEDAVWAFIGGDVGGTSRDDLFLEVHHYVWADYTSDEPSRDLAAGEVEIEVVIPRCEMDFTGSGQVRMEMRLGSGGYGLFASTDIRPLIDDTLFPPVL